MKVGGLTGPGARGPCLGHTWLQTMVARHPLPRQHDAPFLTPSHNNPHPTPYPTQTAGMSALIAAWQGLPPSWLQGTPPCSSPNCSSGSGAPACTWQGVACLRGRVVGIALPNSSGEAAAGITGSIPSGITDLTKLQQLDMRGNRISGPLPGFIANLTDLSSLLLAGNQLGGQLPNGLGLMPRLSVLSLAANFFEGGLPASYGNLSTLTVADLSSSGFSGELGGYKGAAAGYEVYLDLLIGCSNPTLTPPVSH